MGWDKCEPSQAVCSEVQCVISEPERFQIPRSPICTIHQLFLEILSSPDSYSRE